MTDLSFFCDLCRENTGSHILDSGNAYGRHWEKSPITKDTPALTWPARSAPRIELAHFLDDFFDVDHPQQESWVRWVCDQPEDYEKTLSDLMVDYMAAQGMHMYYSQYTYNEDNDLTQDFCYWVYHKKDCSWCDGDWMNCDEGTRVVISVHTGCDARAGFTRPVICVPLSEYIIPQVQAEYWVEGARRFTKVKYSAPTELFDWGGIFPDTGGAGPDKIEDDQLWRLSEGLSAYSGWPYGALVDRVDRWFEHTRTQNSVCVQLKTGELIKVVASVPVCS